MMCGDRWIKEQIPEELNDSILSHYYKWSFKTNNKRYAHVFICNLEGVADLTDGWSAVVDDIAFYIQGETEDVLERSNFYVWFFVKDEISNDLRAEIENDTYCARKIVVSKEKTFDFDIQAELSEIEKRSFSFDVEVEDTDLRTIEKIEMENFRAYKGKSIYDFTTEDGKTAQLSVLFAPNGVGKTTVFDAAEWNLTGAIKRLDGIVGDIPEGRVLKNYDVGNEEPASVKLAFSDGNYVNGDVSKINNKTKKDYNPGRRDSSDAMKALVKTNGKTQKEKKANIEANRKVWDKILLTHDRIDHLLSDQKPEETYKEWMEICGIDKEVTETFTICYQDLKDIEKQIKDNKQQKKEEEDKLKELKAQRPKVDDLRGTIVNYNSTTKWSPLPELDFENVTETAYRRWSGQVDRVRAELDNKKTSLDAEKEYLADQFEQDQEFLLDLRGQLQKHREEEDHTNRKIAYATKEKKLIIPSFVLGKGEEWFSRMKEYLLCSSKIKDYHRKLLEFAEMKERKEKEKQEITYKICKKEEELKENQMLEEELLQKLEEINALKKWIESDERQIHELEEKLVEAVVDLEEVQAMISELNSMELIEDELNPSYMQYAKDECLTHVRQGDNQVYRQVLPLLDEMLQIVYQRAECRTSRNGAKIKYENSKRLQRDLTEFLDAGRKIIRKNTDFVCPFCHTEFTSYEELLEATYLQYELENQEEREKFITLERDLKDYDRKLSELRERYNKKVRDFLAEYVEKKRQAENNRMKLEEMIQSKKSRKEELELRILTIKNESFSKDRYFDYSKEGIASWISSRRENIFLKMQVLERDLVLIDREMLQIEEKRKQISEAIDKEESALSDIPREIYQDSSITESVKDYVNGTSYEETVLSVECLNKELEAVKEELVSYGYEPDVLQQLPKQLPKLEKHLLEVVKHYNTTKEAMIAKKREINRHFDNQDFETLDIEKERETIREALDCMVSCENLIASLTYDIQLECYFRDWKKQNDIVKKLKAEARILDTEQERLNEQLEFQKNSLEENIKRELKKFPISEIYEKLDPHLEFKELTFSFSFNMEDKPCLAISVVNKDGKTFAPEWYFSSAQLNIVAFATYIGKALKSENLPANTIMIDDPIGHFGDINIIGFVDLLRNLVENTKRQVIISTHDSRIFNLIKRKIPVSEYPVKYFDCREMKENVG